MIWISRAWTGVDLGKCLLNEDGSKRNDDTKPQNLIQAM